MLWCVFVRTSICLFVLLHLAQLNLAVATVAFDWAPTEEEI